MPMPHPGACVPCAESRYDSYWPSDQRRVHIASELAELSAGGKASNFSGERIRALQWAMKAENVGISSPFPSRDLCMLTNQQGERMSKLE